MTSTTRTVVLILTGVIAMLLIPYTYRDPEPAKIGGTKVPAGLMCQEDEVIGFDSTKAAPYPLGCVHIDALQGVACDAFETPVTICVDGDGEMTLPGNS